MEPTATGAWWDTGAFMTMAAVHVTVQETVIHLLETVCLGECVRETVFSYDANIKTYNHKSINCIVYIAVCLFRSDLDLYNLEGNSSEPARIFRADELFSALHYSGVCVQVHVLLPQSSDQAVMVK